MDAYITGSIDILVLNSTYDAWCLNPVADISLSPTIYGADGFAGIGAGSVTNYLNPYVTPNVSLPVVGSPTPSILRS
jgi:hypothetical protein